jgi:Ca2+-binding RTX toxin-like protein
MSYYKYDGSLAVVTTAAVQNFYGTTGVDTIQGTAGADGLWGGEGDLLYGGLGDDTYYLRNVNDKVFENANAGIDKIVAWRGISLFDYPNIENLSVAGDGTYAGGNNADNVIEGGEGRQDIYGGRGQDVLIGGAGPDVFIVYKGEGNDVIQDFNVAEDKVRLKAGYTSFAQVQAHLTQQGADVVLDMGGGDAVILRNTTVGQFTAANFQLQLDTSALGALTFADEFSGPINFWDAVNRPNGVWRTDYGYQGSNGYGSYTLASNNELQLYTSPYFRDHNGDFAESPFVVNADGTISIWARPSNNPEIFGYHYPSGMLSTNPTFTQTYGYFEIRADVPSGAGVWPAFWLLPADGSWPPELDVMEILSQDPRAAWTTGHSGVGGHTASGQSNFIPDTSDGFHTYGTLWTPTTLTWYIDGVEVFKMATPADMNKPMFMIANLALGGWAGSLGANALPAEYKIDYIHAYALGSGSPTPPPPPPPPPPPADASTITGTAGNDVLQSTGTGAQTLQGLAGNDALYGGQGVKTLVGGAGDDWYYVNDTDDVIVEQPGEGWDNVWTGISYTAPANVEHIYLGGTAGLDATGNALTNTLYGNDAANRLTGLAGDDSLVGQGGGDTLAGGLGNDTLTGGAGNDRFVFEPGLGNDRVTDFQPGDVLDFQALGAGAGYTLAQVGADAVFTLAAGGSVTVSNVTASALVAGQDFVFQGGATPPPSSPPPLTHATVFSLPLSAAPTNTILGTVRSDSLRGGAGADLIDGKGGADAMVGGAGDDTYVVDNTRDAVSELLGGGVDTVQSTVKSYVLAPNVENGKLVFAGNANLTGNTLDNLLFSNDAGSTLKGGAGRDVLVAGRGADTLIGGAGADVFRFDALTTAAGHVTDFAKGQDVLDLRALFTSYSGQNPIADGWLKFVASGADSSTVMVDPDGPAGPSGFVALTTLDHVLPGSLTMQTDWIFY